MLQEEQAGLSPGAHLRAEIERLGLDQVAIAEATGVSRQTINNIVNRRQAISRAMAAKLGRLTGRSSDYWLRSHFNLQGTRAGHQPDERPDKSAISDRTDFRPVAVLVNHQIIRAAQEGIIGVDPFEPKNVQLASLDLTLDDFIITTEGEEVDISGGECFSLEGGQTVNVRTREWIEFPLDYVGRVGAMTQLAKFGIIMSHGFQVDPGFKGRLQFCLFNAGGKSYELRSGDPIISLEIMPLASTPSHDESTAGQARSSSDRAEVISHFRSDDCNHLVRDFLRRRVKIDAVYDGFSGKVPELEIDIVAGSEEAAFISAVGCALDTLKVIRANPKAKTELSEKYDAFFVRIAERLSLSADQARNAVTSLGLANKDTGQRLVTLRHGSPTILQFPPKSAKITLKNLARQLREDANDLILMLTGMQKCD
jgi:deoxycytidine triphosphate deaminase/addiction module HigA family antidote